MNILISGIASDIGFGAGRILRDWKWPGQLHGVDIHDQHPGLFLFNQCDIAPSAISGDYLEWLEDYINRHGIGLFIPTSEAEISLLAKNNIREISNARILITSPHIIITKSLDKLECMNFLSSTGLRVPRNGIVGEITPKAYPLIVKPRAGQGSKNIQIINNEAEFKSRATSGQIWQEYLSPDDQEYTCPVYRSAERGTQILVIRRTLSGGLTARGEVVTEPRIENYVKAIAEQFDLNGVINVQLRLTSTGPCLFEVNPRLSSTLVFRDKMGFCDLRWWVQDAIGVAGTPNIPTYRPPKPGTKFFRSSKEYISFPNASKDKVST